MFRVIGQRGPLEPPHITAILKAIGCSPWHDRGLLKNDEDPVAEDNTYVVNTEKKN